MKRRRMIYEGKAKILSRPKLACQSGKEASLLVGGEKPNMTTQVSGTSGGGSSNTVEYKEYGIKLKMAPTLNSDGKIILISAHPQARGICAALLPFSA